MSDTEQAATSHEGTVEKKQLVQSRFGAAASDYVVSKVHANGPDLAWIVEAAKLTGKERVLDVATGTGFTALALAPYALEVVALDLTRPMLEAARQVAASRNVTNMRFVEGDAHNLPFADASFDLVSCRHAPHHFPDVQQAAREWARVLKPGGKLILVDSVSPEEPEADALLQEIETLRDPSHVRNHRISEWLSYLQTAGLEVKTPRAFGVVLDIPDWTQRMRTPASDVEKINHLLLNAAPPIRQTLNVARNSQGALSFTLPTALFVGIKPA